MALAPARQLVQALDASVWRSPRPGLQEVFDARELIDWIGTWLEIGSAFAAERLAAVSDEDLSQYLSQIIQVSTSAMWGFERSTEIGDLDRIYAPSHDESAYGSYVARARRDGEWESVRGALDAIWSDDPERLLRLFAQLTGDESMLAPDSDRQGSHRDTVSRRETTRERRGHVTASGARAFLALGTRMPMESLLSLSEYDPETRRHLSGLMTAERAEANRLLPGRDTAFPESAPHEDDSFTILGTEVTQSSEARQRALRANLEAMGLLDAPADRRLLQHEASLDRLSLVARLEELAGAHPMALDARARELAYLSSVLIAGVAVEEKPLTPEEARTAALATCNLGLELSEARGGLVRIAAEPGLVRLFLVGWKALSQVPDRIAAGFTDSLEALRSASSEPLHAWLVDQAETSVTDLCTAIAARELAAAREAALVLAFVFDPNVCRALVPLLDELPHLPPGKRRGDRWIDSVEDLEAVGALLRRLSAKRRPVRRQDSSR